MFKIRHRSIVYMCQGLMCICIAIKLLFFNGCPVDQSENDVSIRRGPRSTGDKRHPQHTDMLFGRHPIGLNVNEEPFPDDENSIEYSQLIGNLTKLKDDFHQNWAAKIKEDLPRRYEVDFRIIVLTNNRSDSLRKCLDYVADIDTIGDTIAIDVSIDRHKNGRVDPDVVKVTRNFSKLYTKGKVNMHIQPKHIGQTHQWIFAWKPRPNTKEIALILEDTNDVSPQVYRWLKLAHSRLKSRSFVIGYSLEMESIRTLWKRRTHIHAPSTDLLFLYSIQSNSGFSPTPAVWTNFQEWFSNIYYNHTDFHPYVKNIVLSTWYTTLDTMDEADSMWIMWCIYFCIRFHKFTVYPNLPSFTNKSNVLLSARRDIPNWENLEIDPNNKELLLQSWDEDFNKLPITFNVYSLGGVIAQQYDIQIQV